MCSRSCPTCSCAQTPDGAFAVELNSDTLPKILLNQSYHARVVEDGAAPTEKSYLAEQLQSATWLIRALDQRARTILKVSTEIVKQQDGFFMHGVQHLRPLNLKTVADAISMHESTVSRVTANKYMATSRGIFELKYFFTSSIASSDGGEAHSAEAVRHRIKHHDRRGDAERRAVGRYDRGEAARIGNRYCAPHSGEIPRGHAHRIFGAAAARQAKRRVTAINSRQVTKFTLRKTRSNAH